MMLIYKRKAYSSFTLFTQTLKQRHRKGQRHQQKHRQTERTRQRQYLHRQIQHQTLRYRKNQSHLSQLQEQMKLFQSQVKEMSQRQTPSPLEPGLRAPGKDSSLIWSQTPGLRALGTLAGGLDSEDESATGPGGALWPHPDLSLTLRTQGHKLRHLTLPQIKLIGCCWPQ